MSTDVTAPPSVERTSEQRIARLFGLTGNAWMRLPRANPLFEHVKQRDLTYASWEWDVRLTTR